MGLTDAEIKKVYDLWLQTPDASLIEMIKEVELQIQPRYKQR